MAGVRWLSRSGESGKVKKGAGAGGKKGKGKQAPTSASDKLHQTLVKELAHEFEVMEETHPEKPKPPKGWKRRDIDDFVNRGDEGILALRKKVGQYRVDVVSSTQLIMPEDDMDMPKEDMDEDDDLDDEGASVAFLVALTKPGRSKPLVIECVANPTSGCTIMRMSVGIDPLVYISSIYGPVTALYVTYAAMREHEVWKFVVFQLRALSPKYPSSFCPAPCSAPRTHSGAMMSLGSLN